MIEDALIKIQNYVDTYLYEPLKNWNKYDIQKRSYERWAAYEIMNSILDHPIDDPVWTIENYMFTVGMYADLDPLAKENGPFMVAIEVAEELLSLVDY